MCSRVHVTVYCKLTPVLSTNISIIIISTITSNLNHSFQENIPTLLLIIHVALQLIRVLWQMDIHCLNYCTKAASSYYTYLTFADLLVFIECNYFMSKVGRLASPNGYSHSTVSRSRHNTSSTLSSKGQLSSLLP